MPRPSMWILSCVLVMLVATAAHAQVQPCAAKVDRVLMELQIDAADLRWITVWPELLTRRRGRQRVVGHKAWVRLKSCDGALIVELKTRCRLRQIYTRGGCSLEGVSVF